MPSNAASTWRVRSVEQSSMTNTWRGGKGLPPARVATQRDTRLLLVERGNHDTHAVERDGW
jgi:hypothetical protein